MDDVCPAPVKERYWEIDAIRGFSLLAMILFHTVFLLGVFHIINVDVLAGAWGLSASWDKRFRHYIRDLPDSSSRTDDR